MLLAFLLSLLVAQPTISGTVKDTSGAAVPGAAVTLETSGGADQQTVISGPDGHFTFSAVPPDATVLVVKAGGFAEARQSVTDLTGSVDVVLQPPSILETVVVTPGRQER